MGYQYLKLGQSLKAGIDSLLFDPAIPEIFYFKHSVGACGVIIFIDNPDIVASGYAIPVLT